MKKSYIFISCIFTFLSTSINAKHTNVADPVVEIVESYVKLINSIKKDNTIDKVLNLYSEQYSGNTTYVRLSGGIVKKSYKKDDIKNQLNDILADENYNLKVKVNKILYSNQKERAGTISELLDFESIIDNKLAEKGTILMNIVIVIQKGEWKVIQNNMVRVSEVKDIGDCICHIFEKGDTQFVTELYYPAGVEYTHKLEAFRITSNEKNRVIKSNNKTFIWENKSDQLIWDKKELGIVKQPKQAIELLIRKMNIETCSTVIFR